MFVAIKLMLSTTSALHHEIRRRGPCRASGTLLRRVVTGIVAASPTVKFQVSFSAAVNPHRAAWGRRLRASPCMRVRQATRMQTDTIDVWCQGPFGIPELAATLRLAVRRKLRRQN